MGPRETGPRVDGDATDRRICQLWSGTNFHWHLEASESDIISSTSTRQPCDVRVREIHIPVPVERCPGGLQDRLVIVRIPKDVNEAGYRRRTRHRIRGIEIEVSERSPIPAGQQRGCRRADHERNTIPQQSAGILHRRDQVERAQHVPTIDLIVPDNGSQKSAH